MENVAKTKTVIRIEVFRHGEKESAQNDHVAALTMSGKKDALEVGALKSPNLRQGFVISSPRERALHSALLQFFGPQFAELNLHDHSVHSTMLELKEQEVLGKMGSRVKLFSKLKTDERLNFNVESHPIFNDRFYQVYNEKVGNRTLDFQLEESDKLILELAEREKERRHVGSENSTSDVMKIKGFKRMVGDLAEVLARYFDNLELWTKIYSSNPTDFDGPEMQIFMASHSQNIECFLMQLIRVKLGDSALKSFLDQLPNHKSFIPYSKGFKLLIEKNEQKNIIGNLYYENYCFEITAADLEQMVKERDDFDQEVLALAK